MSENIKNTAAESAQNAAGAAEAVTHDMTVEAVNEPVQADAGVYTHIKRGETKILKQILFNLVTQAEKQFGSGTGSLKYAAVADWIYQRIPAVLKLLFTSSDIEKMIEAALEEAKKAWGANENLKGYIDTPSVESLLVGIEEQAVQTEPAEN